MQPNRTTLAFQVAIPMKTRNEMNQGFGMSRASMLGKAAARRKQRNTVCLVVRAYLAGRDLERLLPATITVTRVAPSSGLDEHDGLPSALKSVVDGIADAFGLKTDRSSRMAAAKRVEWVLEQRRGPPRVYQVIVRVVPRSALGAAS